MDDELFAFITKYLEDRILSKNKNTKNSQVQWQKLVSKYQLTDGILVLKN